MFSPNYDCTVSSRNIVCLRASGGHAGVIRLNCDGLRPSDIDAIIKFFWMHLTLFVLDMHYTLLLLRIVSSIIRKPS